MSKEITIGEQWVKDGGSAFPQSDSGLFYGESGMSLRDYFAAAALPAVMANGIDSTNREANINGCKTLGLDYKKSKVSDLLAAIAYAQADSMIEARNR